MTKDDRSRLKTILRLLVHWTTGAAFGSLLGTPKVTIPILVVVYTLSQVGFALVLKGEPPRKEQSS